MFLNNPFPGAFGLDIGDLSLKLVRLLPHHPLKGSMYYSVDAIRSIALPPSLIVNGEIQQPETVRKKILQLLEKEGDQPAIRAPWVVVNLPEPKTFLKRITIDTPAKDLLYEDVAYHAKKHVPFEIEETYLDWQVISSETTGTVSTTELLIGAVPKVIANSYTYLLEAAGLSPLALEIESVAVARTMLSQNKDYSNVARAILDLGATRSSLLIYDKDSIQFSTSLNFSGELLTTAIAQALKVDYTVAEKLKITNGLTYDDANPKYLKVISDLVESLLNEIRAALTFYKEHFSDTNPITHITLCGGSSLLKNMDQILTQKLKIGTQPGNVWKNVNPSSVPKETDSHAVNYAAAVGLALRAATNPLQETT